MADVPPQNPLDPEIIRGFVRKIIQQPYNAINLNKLLFGDHVPRIPREVWVKSQIELIKEIGFEKYFYGLLETLENPLTNEEFGQVSEEEVNKIIKVKFQQKMQAKSGVLSPYYNKDVKDNNK